jgi:tetratricopeptide (TPR) repeat protein
MRSLVERLQRDVKEFVEQRDDFVLLIECSEADWGSALAILRDAEQALGSDVFLMFADEFVQPGPFVDQAIERLEEEFRKANEALSGEKREPFPELPKALRDRSRPPADRLRDAICFPRSLVPRDGGHRLVWAMCPERIKDLPAYRGLVGALAPTKGLQSWMTGIRLIFRDEPVEASDPWSRLPGVRRARFDMGPAAIEKSLQEDVENESQPEEQRIQSLLSLALLDSAHGRFREAKEKLAYLLGYFQKTKDAAMEAFVLNAVGDIHRRTGDLASALEWYERATVPAAEAKQPIILATIVKNLGDLAFEQRQYGQAEQYYDNLDKLSAHLLDPEGKVRALERRGLCQEKLGSIGRAVESWEGAATLCRSIGLPPFLKSILEHLERGCRQLRAEAKLRAVQAELKELARARESA